MLGPLQPVSPPGGSDFLDTVTFEESGTGDGAVYVYFVTDMALGDPTPFVPEFEVRINGDVFDIDSIIWYSPDILKLNFVDIPPVLNWNVKYTPGAAPIRSEGLINQIGFDRSGSV